MVNASSLVGGITAYNNAANRASELAANVKPDIAPSVPDSESTGIKGGLGFTQLVQEALNKSMSTGYEAESVQLKSLAGKAEMHELVTAVATAELTLQTVVAVRDKVISAYQDIIRMPI